MNGQDLINLFNSLIDDSLDNDTALILANDAKTELEGERNWSCLKKKDNSQYSRTSDTYETIKTLPVDFDRPLKLTLEGIPNPLSMINFEEQEEYKNQTGHYFIDLSTRCLYLTGTPTLDRRITHFYICSTDEIALGTAWNYFPEKYHRIIAYRMAAKFYNIDFSDISAQVGADRMWLRNAAILQESLNKWDDAIKQLSTESKTGWAAYNDPSRI